MMDSSNKRYVGTKNGSIFVISTGYPITANNEKQRVVEVPSSFDDIVTEDIILKLKFQRNTLVSRRCTKASEMKVAFVGNWKMRCGISTYSEQLWPEIAKHVKDVRLFVEKNASPTSPMDVLGNKKLAPGSVVQCWSRGEHLQELVNAINEYCPDVVHIQHEFGLWANAGYWLSFISQLSNYHVIVTMHSVFHHRDKTIVEAAMPEIIVHSEGAKNVLVNEKGLLQPVHVVPHGCAPVINNEKLWDFYKSDHTFMSAGFLFKYKGWETTIRTCAELKKKYDDVFFTGLLSESPFNLVEHQIYYDELNALVNELGVQNNVALIRGYQSDQSLDSYMRTNNAIMFAYTSHPEHEVFGVSGAARYAMSKATMPVVTSHANHFLDIPTIKCANVVEFADAIDLMFSNAGERKKQIARQVEYVTNNTWEKTGLRHVKIYES